MQSEMADTDPGAATWQLNWTKHVTFDHGQSIM